VERSPFEGRLVDKAGFGKVMVGRGAVNQKGPESAFLSALHAYRAAKRKLPVNLVLVAEGEEEIGSPHFGEVVRRPEVTAALGKSVGVFMPTAAQGPDGEVSISLGAKGVVELELVASGARWGRGPSRDVHSANRARLDSPAFHLVQALASLVTPDGAEPAIDGFADKARTLSGAELQMVQRAAKRMSEAQAKELLGAKRWIHDEDWERSLQRLCGRPTVNIEGLVGGYTGPGGKTMLPARAVAKLDLRLVPDMTAEGALAALKAHLEKRGFGDIEVNMSGGYDPTATSADSTFIKTMDAAYRRAGSTRCSGRGTRARGPGTSSPASPGPSGRSLRAGARVGRPRSGRVLRHRVQQPEGRRARRRGGQLRDLPGSARQLRGPVRGPQLLRCRSASSSLRVATTLEMRPRSMAAGGSIHRSRSIRSTNRSWGVPVRSA
jgi:acetylornithine deacetylase/succinyl-diaminopimelate desuccinylase-like protein